MKKLPPKTVGKTTKTESQWWKTDQEHTHQSVFSIVSDIQRNNQTKEDRYKQCLTLYGDRADDTYFPGIRSPKHIPLNRSVLNITKSCINTAAAKISKNKPRIQFLTDGGDYQLQKKAELLTQFIDGIFYQNKAYTQGQEVFLDACIFGTGAIKVYAEEQSIKLERVPIWEIITDDYECFHRPPRQLHQVRAIFRDKAIALYPESKAQLLTTPAIHKHYFNSFTGSAHNASADLIQIVESWHLPSSNESTDGLHTLSVENCTLLHEPYNNTRFPFAFFRWDNKRFGFYGTSLVEDLAEQQLFLNKLMKNVMKGIHLVATPRVLVEANSQINEAHINNEFSGILKYIGARPEFLTPTAFGPEVYNLIETTIRRMYETSGVSQSSAQSKKPAGLDSGVALREYSDIETERFILVGQRYEEFYQDLARTVVCISRDIYAHKQSVKVLAPGDGFVKKIKWKDVDLDDDSFIMQCFPASSLPQTPAGRLEMVSNLSQMQVFETKEQMLNALNMPDLKNINSLQQASFNYVEQQIDKIVSEGIYESPNPAINLAQAAKQANNAYIRALGSNVPEDRVSMLGEYRDECIALNTPPAPQQPQLPTDQLTDQAV